VNLPGSAIVSRETNQAE